MKNDIFVRDSVVSTPILNITYRNNCNTNYYFFKRSPKKDDRAMVMHRGLLQYPDDDLLKRAKSYRRFTNQNYNVIMGQGPYCDAYWNIFNDTVAYNNIFFSEENINLYIENIYDYINFENYLKISRFDIFRQSDVTPENILLDSTVNEYFVFLEPKQIHIDTYNLIAFKIVEGCFTFIIRPNEIENYVIVRADFIERQEYKLPTVVGEYHLYSGDFNTNKVTVCFGER
jgi:hypothetical protein